MSSLLSSLFIKDLPNCYYVRSNRRDEKNWNFISFMDHLSRALPTKNIFDLIEKQFLPNLNPSYLYDSKSKFDMRKVIKWLKVRFIECNRQLEIPQTNNPICSRDLVPSDRATCTIAS